MLSDNVFGHNVFWQGLRDKGKVRDVDCSCYFALCHGLACGLNDALSTLESRRLRSPSRLCSMS